MGTLMNLARRMATVGALAVFLAPGCVAKEPPPKTPAEQHEAALCLINWLRVMAEAPTCQESATRLQALLVGHPECATELGDGSAFTLVCEDAPAEAPK
jgi:hypothetical protein